MLLLIRGLTVPYSYSRLFFSNQLPTSNFIETSEFSRVPVFCMTEWCNAVSVSCLEVVFCKTYVHVCFWSVSVMTFDGWPSSSLRIYTYYSFKIFLRFWLVKTAHIIHHNQLLLTKYWTNDVKSAARRKLLNRWRQNDVKSAARCRLLNRWPRKPGDKVVLFWWAEKQRAKWHNSFKNGEIFWMNNKAIIEFGFHRIWRILQISEGVIHLGLWPLDNTLLDLQNSLYPTKPHSIIANYWLTGWSWGEMVWDETSQER